ncbi:MAG: sigma 54-interacting transcriptional regulator [Myxococcota bacterium]
MTDTALTLAGTQDPSDPLDELGCLIVVSGGSDAHRSVELGRGPVRIGTSELCELRLRDPKVSRVHVELSIVGDGIRVRDTESKNGIRYAGRRIEIEVLPLGSTIRIGDSFVTIIPKPSTKSEDDAEFTDEVSYQSLLGASQPMRRLFHRLKKIESSLAPVLILGETGVGKELVAQAIHDASKRAEKPFVPFDCGAVPKELIESELFGHVRGAFTGADRDRSGVFEQANTGTIFLDEIGELAPELQTRLLRVLESGTLKRVGDSTVRRVDVRVLSATHCNLAQAVESREFRADLFYRLAVVTVQVPPLRDRVEDIPQLVSAFCRAIGDDRLQLTPETLAELTAHQWPGNVRELRNVVHRLLALGETELAPLGTSSRDLSYKEARDRVIENFERSYLGDLYRSNSKNISATARQAELSRSHLRTLLQKYDLYDES